MNEKPERFKGHTPGPWHLEDHGHTFIVSKPGDGYITRKVCVMDGSTMAAFAQKANAELIAAAPSLLAENERLREIVARWANHHRGCGMVIGNLCNCGLDTAINALRRVADG